MPTITHLSTPTAAAPILAIDIGKHKSVVAFIHPNRKAGNAWLKWAFSEAAVLNWC